MVRDKIYPEAIILQAVRRSLRGTAADILLHLGETVSVDEVLGKFEKVFGNILPPEAILEKFFSAKQIDGERVVTWACRLEDIQSCKIPKMSHPRWLISQLQPRCLGPSSSLV